MECDWRRVFTASSTFCVLYPQLLDMENMQPIIETVCFCQFFFKACVLMVVGNSSCYFSSWLVNEYLNVSKTSKKYSHCWGHDSKYHLLFNLRTVVGYRDHVPQIPYFTEKEISLKNQFHFPCKIKLAALHNKMLIWTTQEWIKLDHSGLYFMVEKSQAAFHFVLLSFDFFL